MGALRVITVLEHETVPIVSDDEAASWHARHVHPAPPYLTNAEALGLLRRSESGPRFCERTSEGIRFAQFCGLLRQPSFVLEILPKTGLNDARRPEEETGARRTLLHMLSCVGNLSLRMTGSVSQDAVRSPLLDVFIQAFLGSALEQACRGLLHRYIGRSESLRTARGRFNVHGHIRENHARPHVLFCDHDEFTADNPYNQAIRSTLDVCRPWLSTPAGQRLWLEANTRFADVTPSRMRTIDVVRLRRDRGTAPYDIVLGWCELLLSLLNPSLRSGTSVAPGLLFDMNRLFEGYVHYLESVTAGSGVDVIAQGPVLHLASSGQTPVFRLKPDITVFERDAPVSTAMRIVDAKWKRLQPGDDRWGVSPHDLYQLLAYAVRYGCTALELVYPAPDGQDGTGAPPTLVIEAPALASPVRITVRTLDLTASGHAA